jgi:hypothetical protein
MMIVKRLVKRGSTTLFVAVVVLCAGIITPRILSAEDQVSRSKSFGSQTLSIFQSGKTDQEDIDSAYIKAEKSDDMIARSALIVDADFVRMLSALDPIIIEKLRAQGVLKYDAVLVLKREHEEEAALTSLVCALFSLGSDEIGFKVFESRELYVSNLAFGCFDDDVQRLDGFRKYFDNVIVIDSGFNEIVTRYIEFSQDGERVWGQDQPGVERRVNYYRVVDARNNDDVGDIMRHAKIMKNVEELYDVEEIVLDDVMNEYQIKHKTFTVQFTTELQNKIEKDDAQNVAAQLHKRLETTAESLEGGYGKRGYGVPSGAAIDGNFAIGDEGDQGYYVDKTADGRSGKEVFIGNVKAMRDFFERRKERIGKSIKYVIKTGIGGQHTPFQGIAEVFQVIELKTGKVVGEYDLGKDYRLSIAFALKALNADWEQVAVIPSSKSGSTDETMLIFVDIFGIMLAEVAKEKGYNGDVLSDAVLAYLHDLNFRNGVERPGQDLFKGFSFPDMIERINTNGKWIKEAIVRDIFGIVLGNMFFETTDRSSDSRLSAFIRNSGLDKELGEDVPGFGAMFDNVGGRWTGDLHMMTFLAYHNATDAEIEAYWQERYDNILKVREGTHAANELGNYICDNNITDIALVVPDEFFWFGKSIEQNFNESIWQKGFANLVAIKASNWEYQQQHYGNKKDRLVINLSALDIKKADLNVYEGVKVPVISAATSRQDIALMFARLFSTFYGMTYTVGNRLIGRAIRTAGLAPGTINVDDLGNPATRILQENLYLRQPYVELGKGLLEARLNALQKQERTWEVAGNPQEMSPIKAAQKAMVDSVAEGAVVTTNIPELSALVKKAGEATSMEELAEVFAEAQRLAEKTCRKFVPFIYLDGADYYELRDYLIKLGIEWVMQGTGDQHISYQQVLSQPQKYLAFFVSSIPVAREMASVRPAIGFARGYLDNISPDMVRHYFAQASYEALTVKRADAGGQGVFVSMRDNGTLRKIFKRNIKKMIDSSIGPVAVVQAA